VRAAARLFLCLCDYDAQHAEQGLCLDTLDTFEQHLDDAIGSSFAAIIPVTHKDSGRPYVLKMQKVWLEGQDDETDEWGNAIEWHSHIEQGHHEYAALQKLGPCPQVLRAVAEFIAEELQPPEDMHSDESIGPGTEDAPESPLSPFEPVRYRRSPPGSPLPSPHVLGQRTHFMVLEQWQDDGDNMLSLHGMEGLPEREALLTLLQLAMGLDRCAQCDIVWNDAKLNNVLLDERGALCLADFGLWCRISEYRYRGSYFNKAPEAAIEPDSAAMQRILALDAAPVEHTQVDMWGLGCIAYQLGCGPMHPRDESGHPFEMDMENVLKYISGKYTLPSDIGSPKLQVIAEALLAPHPRHRPTPRMFVMWLRELLWSGATPLGGIAARNVALHAVINELRGNPLNARKDLVVEQEMLLEAICDDWPDDT